MMRRLALAATLLCACGDDAGFPDARVDDGAPAGGRVSLTWTLADSGMAISCEQVGAVTVTLTFVPKNGVFGFTEAFSCTSGRGTTPILDAGTYDIDVSLGGGGGAIATFPRFAGVVVTSGQDTALGAVAFEVDATGGLRFRATASGADSNCGAIVDGGAGIAGLQLELRTLGGTCVPTVFQVAAGAERPASTYMSTCANPPPGPCVDADQDVTVAAVTSGRYQLVMRGFIGATACWEGNPTVRVPGGGAVGNVGSQLLVETAATGCPTGP